VSDRHLHGVAVLIDRDRELAPLRGRVLLEELRCHHLLGQNVLRLIHVHDEGDAHLALGLDLVHAVGLELSQNEFAELLNRISALTRVAEFNHEVTIFVLLVPGYEHKVRKGSNPDPIGQLADLLASVEPLRTASLALLDAGPDSGGVRGEPSGGPDSLVLLQLASVLRRGLVELSYLLACEDLALGDEEIARKDVERPTEPVRFLPTLTESDHGRETDVDDDPSDCYTDQNQG
jgi:hypothetical protein